MYRQLRVATIPRPLSDQLQGAHDRPLVVHPRMAWILYYEQKRNVRAVCQKFGISRKTFYKWLKRYRKSNGDPASLVDVSRRPHRFPRATSREVLQILLQVKKETGYGQRRLKQYLAEKYNISISEHTIWKLLKRYNGDNGLGVHATPSTPEIRPGSIVQIVVRNIAPYINQHEYVQYTAFDACTKLRISKVYRKYSWRSAADFVKLAIERFPFSIKELQTPEDDPFTNSQAGNEISTIMCEPVPALLEKANIKHTVLPEDQLKQTPAMKLLQEEDEEFFKRNSYRKLDDLIRAAAEYVTVYNNHRKHSDLNGLTPLQKLRSYPEYKNIVYFDPYA